MLTFYEDLLQIRIKRELDKSVKLGFATVIDTERVLKNVRSLYILRFFRCIYRSTQPTDLFSNWRYYIGQVFVPVHTTSNIYYR